MLLAPDAYAQDKPTLAFISVGYDGTAEADEKLRGYLTNEKNIPVNFKPEEKGYEAAIKSLVTWDAGNRNKGFFLARVTPYVFVVAEMQGAGFEVLGTYKSEVTKDTTYHAYFVVKKSDLRVDNPGLSDLIKYLDERETPARFIYHSKFSTSSYFLPSLYFQRNGVFSVEPFSTSGEFIPINSEKNRQ